MTFFLTSRDVTHIRNKKNDQARQNQKQIEEPLPEMMFHFLHQDRKTQMKKKMQNQLWDMLDEGEQSVDSNKPSTFDPIVTVDNAKGKPYCYKYFRPYKS